MKGRRSRHRATDSPRKEGSEHQADEVYYSDQPIQRCDEDLFGRSAFAKNLAQSIAKMPGPEPFVFGLSGPWGSGKTSLLNMVVQELQESQVDGKKVVVFRFNPWWFSGSDALLLSFLREFAKVLGMEIKGASSKKLAKCMTLLGHLLKPARFIPGATLLPVDALAESVASGGKALKEAGELASQDVIGLRRDIDHILLKKKQPVLVVIDDLDRLLPEEVIQVFRIVKAVADFPFVRYLLAYDDVKVCSMVKSAMDIDGREFLEKIVQMPVELPAVAKSQLQRVFIVGLNSIVSDTPERLVDQIRFGNVFHDGIIPFLVSPRAVKRLLNLLRVTYPPLKGEVDVADFLAIQTVMVFAPEAYRVLRDEPNWFIGRWDRTSKEEARAFCERWQRLSRPETMEAMTRLMRRTFPRFGTLMGGPQYSDGFESTWSNQLQAASERHFPTYFRMVLTEGMLSDVELGAFIEHLNDAQTTDSWLLNQLQAKGPSGEGTRVGEVLTVLNDVARADGRLNDEQRACLLASLLRVGDELSRVDDAQHTSPLFTLRNDLRLRWVLQGLIGGIVDTLQKVNILAIAFGQGRAYATMLDLAVSLGSEHGLYGSKGERGAVALVDKETCVKLAQLTVEKVKEAQADGNLAKVHKSLAFANMWWTLGGKDDAISWLRKTCEADEKLLAVVREGVSEGHSWGMDATGGGMGDRVARTSLCMAVEYLCGFFDARVLRGCAEKLLQNKELVKTLDKETVFGLTQLRGRIQEDGNVIPEKNNFGWKS